MITIGKIRLTASGQGARLFRIWNTVLKMLTFSPADDRIFPGKDISVALHRGTVSLAYGTRFLSAIRIKETKKYLFAEDRYPLPEELLSSLSLAFSEFDLSVTGITLSIPKEWTIVRTVDFPSTVKENIQNVIAFELDRLTPFAAEEAFFDFRLLRERDGRLSLVLMAVKTEHLKPYLDSLNEGGFAVNRITVNLSAIGALCSYLYKKSDFLFIETGRDGYEGALFSNGLPVNTFSGAFTGMDETSRVSALAGEIAPMLQTSDSRNNTLQLIALIKDQNPAFRKMLGDRLQIPVSVPEETATGLRLPQPVNDVPWVAVGSVVQSLNTGAEKINLLKKGQHEKQKVPYALTMLLLLLIAIVWGGYLIAPLKIEKRKLQEVSSRLAAKKEEARKVEDLIKEAEALSLEISAIKNFKGDRTMTLTIIKELTTLLPRNAWTYRVKISASSITIEGYADAATELLPKLEASPLFKKVEFASPTVRDPQKKADRFNIKMEREETAERGKEPAINAKK